MPLIVQNRWLSDLHAYPAGNDSVRFRHISATFYTTKLKFLSASGIIFVLLGVLQLEFKVQLHLLEIGVIEYRRFLIAAYIDSGN